MEYADLLYGPVYTAFGVPAMLTPNRPDAALVAVAVVERTTSADASEKFELGTLRPAAFVRRRELTDAGTLHAWRRAASRRASGSRSPNGRSEMTRTPRLKAKVERRKGAFIAAFMAKEAPIAEAATRAIEEAAAEAKAGARAQIAAAGFGAKWQNALRADVYLIPLRTEMPSRPVAALRNPLP